MIKKSVCEVCKEAEHKYRCPQCRIIYCSLSCYKIHKDDCSKKEDKKDDINGTQVDIPMETSIPEFTLNDEESEDRVSTEQLRLLENSGELREILTNRHLRQMMTSLVHSRNPGAQLEKAMQEPIFTEFADKCLSVIEIKRDES